jgi:Cd2+/Zn2+-exporting ATPase
LGPGQHFHIPTMDCASEEAQIRRALEGLTGLRSLRFQLGQRLLSIEAEGPTLAAALAAIRQAGFEPQPLMQASLPAAQGVFSSPQRRLAAALAFALAAEAVAFWAPQGLAWQGLGMAAAGVALWLSGWEVFHKGVQALVRGQLNINALMSVAVSGAVLIGEWPEAAMVMALYAIAEALEARAVDRARHAIASLMQLAPARVLMQRGNGQWESVEAEAVPIGARLRVRPGERIALDGRVLQGRSSVDQSALTGESLPVDKSAGDALFSGALNQAGELEMQTTALAQDSSLARIIHAVEQAQASRSPTQRFVDRFAEIYTPAVFAIALAVALLGPLLAGWSWLGAAYKALVLLVIACPCALVISTPVTVVSALTAAARRGILIKGGRHLEQARRIRAVALDKTGTLTISQPALVAFEPLRELKGKATLDDLKALAASLAARSDHPVSRAIAKANARGLVPDLTPGLAQGSVQGLAPMGADNCGEANASAHEVSELELLSGSGLRGVVNGQRLALLKPGALPATQALSTAQLAAVQAHEAAGRSVSLLVDADGALALCAVADTLRPEAAAAVAELKAMGVTPVMLTGDNASAARSMAAQAGITELRAELLPEHKLQAIDELKQTCGPTAMAGDGINDAPALARADIGFAMAGPGNHTAMETADVVLMHTDLRRLPETLKLSQRTHAVLWQNITLALGIKLAFLALAVFDHASMWMAVFADMGASLLVVFNGMRLLHNGPRPGQATRHSAGHAPHKKHP